MTPKEKAQELIEEFYLCMPFKDVKLTSCGEPIALVIKMEKLSAKQCSLIAVNEILKVDFIDTVFNLNSDVSLKEYWEEVKKEVEQA